MSKEDLVIRAEAYFGRPSFSAPAYVGQDTIAFLDDRSGTTQVSLLDVVTGSTLR